MTDEFVRRPTFSDLPAGATIAQDYRVVRPLSSGGMGAIYVVDQISTKKRRALKVMRPEFVANEALRRRFLQEARVSADIDSDHVVEVIGAGVDEATGIPWLAMELLSGYDLESFARRHAPLSAATLRTLFEQLCHALGAAHDQRIIHRDLKPENVFLAGPRRAGAPFTVKILDFGIAKALAEAKTYTTDAVGTPLWMSPEQTSPSATIAPSSDVWALGLIAFRLVTGKIYWLAAHHPEVSAVMAMRETLIDPLPSASDRARALGCPPPPPGFDAWFARCVVRDTAERYPDARAAYEGLRDALGGAGDGTPPTYSFPPAASAEEISNAPTEFDPARLAEGRTGRATTDAPGRATLGPRTGRAWVSTVIVSLVVLAGIATLVIGLSVSRRGSPAPAAPSGPPYDVRVLSDAPIAYFRFGDAGALDVVGGVQGTFVGAHEEGPSALPNDGSARLTGGHLEIPAHGLVVASGPIGVEAWIQVEKLDEEHRGLIDAEAVTGEDYEGFRMYITRSAGRPLLRFGRVYRDSKWDVATEYPDDGAFHHVAGTYDGDSTTCVYVDAKPTCSDRGSPFPPMKLPTIVYVGARMPGLGKGEAPLPLGASTPGAFYGAIDELALFDQALPASAVRAHFEARAGR